MIRTAIENRQNDSCCTARWLKEENRKVLEGFGRTGEHVILIDDNYPDTEDLGWIN